MLKKQNVRKTKHPTGPCGHCKVEEKGFQEWKDSKNEKCFENNKNNAFPEIWEVAHS